MLRVRSRYSTAAFVQSSYFIRQESQLVPQQSSGNIRIIAGNARSRRIRFTAYQGLRPTPDRVRETLFNWLSDQISGAICLDLYAGSGALGLEALSRGAIEVTFVESNRRVVSDLRHNIQLLNFTNGTVLADHADSFLRKTDQQFDLVFLDPPYDLKGFTKTLSLINSREILRPGASIYVEQRSNVEGLEIPADWEIYRQQQCGEVLAKLYKVTR